MVVRRTAKVPITLDAKNDEVEKYNELLEEERRLTRESARLESKKRGPITKKINATRKQMAARLDAIKSGQVTVTVTALSHGQYRTLLKEHPPTEDETDQKYGYNQDTFLRPLLEAATVQATDSDGNEVQVDFDAWLDDGSEGLEPAETLTWFNAALGLQTGRVNQSPLRRAS